MFRGALLLGWLALMAPVDAASSAADEMLAALQTCLARGGDARELTGKLRSLPGNDIRKVAEEVDKAWPKLRDRYLEAFGAALLKSSGASGKADRGKIRELREQFHGVYAMDGDAMKPLLGSKSEPAVEQLRAILLPSVKDLLEKADPKLLKQRETTRALGAFRMAALDAALLPSTEDSMATLDSAEQAVATKNAGLDRDGVKVLEKNRKIVVEAKIPADEARGIEDCNVMRLLVGLNACLIDPKLCEAARGHSSDMQSRGFFAHESPVPGKTTPWDRAKLAGTSACSENIFAGSPDPHGAIMAWFHSPGHHKNMFATGVTRMGLGRAGGAWTQMFGN